MTTFLIATFLLLGVTGCSKPDDAKAYEFQPVAVTESASCIGECVPTVRTSCDLFHSADVVALVTVETRNFVLEPCADAVYKSGYYDYTLRVLNVLEGELDATVNVRSIADSLDPDVGDVAVVGLRQIDGIWLLRETVPVELHNGDAAPVDHTADDASIIFDIPTTTASLAAELQTLRAENYGSCEPVPSRATDDQVRASIYNDGSCADVEGEDGSVPTPDPTAPTDEDL